MEITITVKYYTDRHGAGKLRAIGAGNAAARRQITIGYPHHLHHSEKYFFVADKLVQKLENVNGWRLRLVGRKFTDSSIARKSFETFYFEVFDQTVPRFWNWKAIRLDSFPAGYAS